jgi:16S rRNA (guanine966-N2)-methyltransferase
MRIISGKYKGRLFQMPENIRPTQDKVRKAIFDILGDIKGLSFLELFAGSGAVGLEAVSHGIKELVFVEHNRACLQAIKKNIESLAVNSCDLYPLEAKRAIQLFHKDRRKFDLIFLDPPYSKVEAGLSAASGFSGKEESLTKKTLQTLVAYDIVAPTGLVVVEHFKKDNLPEALGDLVLFKQRRYADTLLSFYIRF